MKKTISATLLAATTFALASNGVNAGEQLIAKLTHNQVKVSQTFSVSKDLQGFVIAPKSGGHSGLMFATKDGSLLIMGNIINGEGQNLTQVYTDKYINAKLAVAAGSSIATQTHYFTQGSAKAPHHIYVFFDPNCSACHMFYTVAHPAIEAGKLQVRWIPVAFLKPSSPAKAAQILGAGNDKAQAAMLYKDEKGFDMKNESGGIKGLDKNSANQKYFDMVTANTKYFTAKGFYVTPTILYKDKNGKSQYVAGAMPPGPAFNGFLDKTSTQW